MSIGKSLTFAGIAAVTHEVGYDEYAMEDLGNWLENEKGEQFVLMSRKNAYLYKDHPDFKGRIIVKRQEK